MSSMDSDLKPKFLAIVLHLVSCNFLICRLGIIAASQDNCVVRMDGIILVKAFHEDKALSTINCITGEEKDAYLWVLGKTSYSPLKLSNGRWFPKSRSLAGPLSPQVISMVMVAIGVYARLMKHTGELQAPLCLSTTLARALPSLSPSALHHSFPYKLWD